MMCICEARRLSENFKVHSEACLEHQMKQELLRLKQLTDKQRTEILNENKL